MDAMTQELLDNIAKLEGAFTDIKAWDPGLLYRIIKRLSSFPQCAQCRDYLQVLSEHIRDIMDRRDEIDKTFFREHKQFVQAITAHLQKEHGLVANTSYTGLYMVLGMNFGLVFGMTVLDNLALGLSMGMCMGVCLGAAMDADIKKKGKII